MPRSTRLRSPSPVDTQTVGGRDRHEKDLGEIIWGHACALKDPLFKKMKDIGTAALTSILRSYAGRATGAELTRAFYRNSVPQKWLDNLAFNLFVVSLIKNVPGMKRVPGMKKLGDDMERLVGIQVTTMIVTSAVVFLMLSMQAQIMTRAPTGNDFVSMASSLRVSSCSLGLRFHSSRYRQARSGIVPVKVSDVT
ncbi:hypothetical protein BDV93DRAFT_516741 [Ceratobasidium sp. AG-I]|nr:hypothetical protein BDV93DRAFT_516741 [Ceratobasidium sp. AG-I]